MTTTGVPASLDDDVLGEDWFGEGSVFDSGEELAAALVALATSPRAGARRAPPSRPATSDLVAVPAVSRRAPPGASHPAAPGGEMGEFQVAAMPSFANRGPEPAASRQAGWQRSPADTSRPQVTGWSIRQSVQILRTTEEILIRLREEAAELAWRWTAAVHDEVDPASRAPASGLG